MPVKTTFDFPEEEPPSPFWANPTINIANTGNSSYNFTTHVPYDFNFLHMPPPRRQPPPPPLMSPCRDTRTRIEKLQDLAARGSTLGERNAAIHALARLQAKGEI